MSFDAAQGLSRLCSQRADLRRRAPVEHADDDLALVTTGAD